MFEIREYKRQDHRQLTEMISTVLAEFQMSLDFTGPDKDIEDLKNVYIKNGEVFFVVELDGIIIGSVGVSKIDDEKCRLCKLYVLREHRRQGLGRMILETAIDFASSNGYRKMELEVSEKHKDVIRLYKKLGFAKTGIRSCCPRCDFIYAKQLRKGQI